MRLEILHKIHTWLPSFCHFSRDDPNSSKYTVCLAAVLSTFECVLIEDSLRERTRGNLTSRAIQHSCQDTTTSPEHYYVVVPPNNLQVYLLMPLQYNCCNLTVKIIYFPKCAAPYRNLRVLDHSLRTTDPTPLKNP